MTTNSKSDVDQGLEDKNTEWIDKVVLNTFEELFTEISSKTKLHKSEEHNRDPLLSSHLPSRIYDDINHYHSFCKFCEQHFYSRSVASDINSFFQKHLNTSYHRQIRSVKVPPDDVPIFTWEEKFRTGRCNICQMSALNSYVLQTKLDMEKIMKLHVCTWDKENRENNLKVLRKLTLLKKYCACKIFQEKLLKTVNGRAVCLLCSMKLPWPKGKATCHLISDGHYWNFCVFLRKCFNFTPKDILNGFNLELVTRSMITRDPPPITKFTDFDERKACFEQSNNNENPYVEEKDNFGFSPKLVEKLIENENDFFHNNRCLLCNVDVDSGHLDLESHQRKTSFDDPENYKTYCKNKAIRLQIVECLRRLEAGKDEPTPVPTPKKTTGKPRQMTAEANYFTTLFKEKLELVKLTFTNSISGEVLCQICDECVSNSYKELHLNGPNHKWNKARWEELKTDFANKKFTESFKVIRNLILCLLCGAVVKPNSFYSHIKGEMHKGKFQCYKNTKVPVAISSAFSFQDFSCTCTICSAVLSKKVSFTSLKATLRNIRSHWPCPKLKDGKTDLKEVNTTEDVAGYRTLEKNGRESRLEGVGMDFDRVEKTVEEIVDVFEKKILDGVVEKSASFIDRMDDLKLVVEESSFGGQKSNSFNHPESTSNSSEKEVQGNMGKVFRSDLNAQKTENNFEKRGEEEEENKKGMEKEKGGTKEKEEGDEEKEDTEEEEGEREQREEEEVEEKEDTEDEEEEREEKEDTEEEEGGREKKEAKEIGEKEDTEEEGGEREKKEEDLELQEGERKVMEEEEIEQKERGQKNEEKDKLEEEHEVLIITGLRRNKRTYETIYSKCNVFGKIRYVFFEGKKTIVAFAEAGVAKKVAKETSLFVGNQKVPLKVSTRKANIKPVEKLPLLHKDLVSLLENPQKLMDFALNLIVQAVTASESLVERKREELVCSTIISAISDCFPQSRCYPFGSRLSGLTLNNSDLDVFLDCGGMYEGFKNTSPSTERKLVNRVAGLLRKKQEITEIIVVSRARVPIVSFLHKPTLIHCDLSFKNGLSIQNTWLIKFMMSLDWRVRPLILFLKHWAKLNGLHGPPNFSSYAIAMMVIFFLERLEPPVLPTIESLQKSYTGRRITIGGWDCSINSDMGIIQKTENKDPLPQLLVEFFDFYASFDYENYVISPLTGTVLPREAFSESGFGKLPMAYKRHILNVPMPIESLVKKIPICVFDPFDLSHVLTKNFSGRGLQIFTHLSKTSAENMKKGMAVFKNQP